jgi:hypothetical protein
MKIKFFNLNIKHKYHSFDPKMSAAEYWLNDKNAAPIFYGEDTFEDILSGRSPIKKKYEKIVNKFLGITSHADTKPIFVTIDSGFLWIYEPIGKDTGSESCARVSCAVRLKPYVAELALLSNVTVCTISCQNMPSCSRKIGRAHV